ncbi:hypothetical protein SAMN05519104_3654 [Rhizobiales bacterium GAS188]|nr:hypothetical protein SAMN05519104_3654 [Rhizobiales bacterium GAS188]
MHKCLHSLVALFSVNCASGCAIHPDPGDYAGVSTYHIVRQIRCETRQAVFASIVELLTSGENPNKVNEGDYQTGLKYSSGANMQEFRPNMLKGPARKFVDIIWNTAIVYNYNLEMGETNNLDTEINLLKTLPTATRMLGLKGNFDRTRQNTRVFTISDSFGDLVSKLPSRYCTKYIAQENIVYPIAGKIGMEAVIHDFINLAIYANLSGDGAKSVTDPPGPPTMADQLEFKTTLTASATPKVTFTPVGPGLHVADASLTALATREDTHQLTIGLAVPTKANHGLTNTRDSIFVGLITADTTTGPKLAAAQAADQLIAQKLLAPKIVITP